MVSEVDFALGTFHLTNHLKTSTCSCHFSPAIAVPADDDLYRCINTGLQGESGALFGGDSVQKLC